MGITTLPEIDNSASRTEMYLRAIANRDSTNLPAPVSRNDYYLKYICENINSSTGDSGNASMNQIVKMDVKGNEKIIIPFNEENVDDKLIIHCYEYLESLETIITIMKQFNNSNSRNFHYNSELISFDGGMHIKNEYNLNMALNSEGVYESEALVINEFLGDIEVTTGGNDNGINTKRR